MALVGACQLPRVAQRVQAQARVPGLPAPKNQAPERRKGDVDKVSAAPSDVSAEEAEGAETLEASTKDEISSETELDYPLPRATGGEAKRTAGSTDAVSTFLTRRFGLTGGLIWLGILAVGAIGEQIKTRLEVRSEREGAKDVKGSKEVVTASGLRYVDTKIGGGAYPQNDFLVVIQMRGTANGEVFIDTKARGKAIVFIFGKRPFTGGLTLGVEEALRSMKAGGKRRVTIPPELGFGEGAVLFPDETDPQKKGIVPPNATLVVDLELDRVSIPPS
ncbi:unnamed protein product [Ostreobium quekettii]|uniref:peptidylprolyl isomerase n=1 Tax=Ostreobium quekettii TaxID=121088 RepID=A0A8S1IQ54_9CHLO|nr:unnamed protein product [Ostreobium quekettii]|eukprot:evm.model.scf_695.3 EVM.evm.TU.scf_695.3   scf_695:26710-29666(+)